MTDMSDIEKLREQVAALEKQVEAISKYLRVTAKATDAACEALLIAPLIEQESR